MSLSSAVSGRQQTSTSKERADLANRVPYRFAADPKVLWKAIEEHGNLPRPPKAPPDDWEPAREDRAELWRRKRRRIMDDRLRALDTHVLKVILGFKPRVSYLRWCPQSVIMRELGKKERTIRLSYRRLARNGFIRLMPVPVPDPDDPRNKTGYRIILLFDETVPPELKAFPDVDRRPPLERKVWTRVGAEAADPVASPPTPLFEPQTEPLFAQPVASEMAQPVASKQWRARGSKDFLELDSESPSSSLGAAESFEADDDEIYPSTGETGTAFEDRGAALAEAIPPAELPGPELGQAEAPAPAPGRELVKSPPAAEEPLRTEPDLFCLAVELAREFIDPKTAEAIGQENLPRLARRLGADRDPARWMILVATVALCGMMRPRRSKPFAWIMSTACLDFAIDGLSAEAERAFDEIMRRRDDNARARAQQEAAEKQRSGPKRDGDDPPTEQDLAELRDWAAGRGDRIQAGLAIVALVNAGDVCRWPRRE